MRGSPDSYDYWGKVTAMDFESIAIPYHDAHFFYIGDGLWVIHIDFWKPDVACGIY